jgi:hypothetical protein
MNWSIEGPNKTKASCCVVSDDLSDLHALLSDCKILDLEPPPHLLHWFSFWLIAAVRPLRCVLFVPLLERKDGFVACATDYQYTAMYINPEMRTSRYLLTAIRTKTTLGLEHFDY